MGEEQSLPLPETANELQRTILCSSISHQKYLNDRRHPLECESNFWGGAVVCDAYNDVLKPCVGLRSYDLMNVAWLIRNLLV